MGGNLSTSPVRPFRFSPFSFLPVTFTAEERLSIFPSAARSRAITHLAVGILRLSGYPHRWRLLQQIERGAGRPQRDPTMLISSHDHHAAFISVVP